MPKISKLLKEELVLCGKWSCLISTEINKLEHIKEKVYE